MTTVDVSVVVATYNRKHRWPRLLDALGRQTVDPDRFEVIAVSDGSDDGTEQLLQAATTRFAFTILSQPNGGPASARNAGVRVARGSLIIFIDDDIVPEPQLIERHLAGHLVGHDDVVIIGPMLNPPDARLSAPVRWEQAMLYKQYVAMERGEFAPTYRQFFTGNASVARTRVLAVGGFDERYRRAEDIELARRLGEAGARFVFDPDARAHHYAERSYGAWLQNARAYGVNDVELSRDGSLDVLLERTRREFLGRHPLVRALTRACVRWAALEALAQPAIRMGARLSDTTGASAVSQALMSASYNVAYYSGMRHALGSRARMLTALS